MMYPYMVMLCVVLTTSIANGQDSAANGNSPNSNQDLLSMFTVSMSVDGQGAGDMSSANNGTGVSVDAPQLWKSRGIPKSGLVTSSSKSNQVVDEKTGEVISKTTIYTKETVIPRENWIKTTNLGQNIFSATTGQGMSSEFSLAPNVPEGPSTTTTPVATAPRLSEQLFSSKHPVSKSTFRINSDDGVVLPTQTAYQRSQIPGVHLVKHPKTEKWLPYETSKPSFKKLTIKKSDGKEILSGLGESSANWTDGTLIPSAKLGFRISLDEKTRDLLNSIPSLSNSAESWNQLQIILKTIAEDQSLVLDQMTSTTTESSLRKQSTESPFSYSDSSSNFLEQVDAPRALPLQSPVLSVVSDASPKTVTPTPGIVDTSHTLNFTDGENITEYIVNTHRVGFKQGNPETVELVNVTVESFNKSFSNILKLTKAEIDILNSILNQVPSTVDKNTPVHNVFGSQNLILNTSNLISDQATWEQQPPVTDTTYNSTFTSDVRFDQGTDTTVTVNKTKTTRVTTTNYVMGMDNDWRASTDGETAWTTNIDGGDSQRQTIDSMVVMPNANQGISTGVTGFFNDDKIQGSILSTNSTVRTVTKQREVIDQDTGKVLSRTIVTTKDIVIPNSKTQTTGSSSSSSQIDTTMSKNEINTATSANEINTYTNNQINEYNSEISLGRTLDPFENNPDIILENDTNKGLGQTPSFGNRPGGLQQNSSAYTEKKITITKSVIREPLIEIDNVKNFNENSVVQNYNVGSIANNNFEGTSSVIVANSTDSVDLNANNVIAPNLLSAAETTMFMNGNDPWLVGSNMNTDKSSAISSTSRREMTVTSNTLADKGLVENALTADGQFLTNANEAFDWNLSNQIQSSDSQLATTGDSSNRRSSLNTESSSTMTRVKTSGTGGPMDSSMLGETVSNSDPRTQFSRTKDVTDGTFLVDQVRSSGGQNNIQTSGGRTISNSEIRTQDSRTNDVTDGTFLVDQARSSTRGQNSIQTSGGRTMAAVTNSDVRTQSTGTKDVTDGTFLVDQVRSSSGGQNNIQTTESRTITTSFDMSSGLNSMDAMNNLNVNNNLVDTSETNAGVQEGSFNNNILLQESVDIRVNNNNMGNSITNTGSQNFGMGDNSLFRETVNTQTVNNLDSSTTNTGTENFGSVITESVNTQNLNENMLGTNIGSQSFGGMNNDFMSNTVNTETTNTVNVLGGGTEGQGFGTSNDVRTVNTQTTNLRISSNQVPNTAFNSDPSVGTRQDSNRESLNDVTDGTFLVKPVRTQGGQRVVVGDITDGTFLTRPVFITRNQNTVAGGSTDGSVLTESVQIGRQGSVGEVSDGTFLTEPTIVKNNAGGSGEYVVGDITDGSFLTKPVMVQNTAVVPEGSGDVTDGTFIRRPVITSQTSTVRTQTGDVSDGTFLTAPVQTSTTQAQRRTDGISDGTFLVKPVETQRTDSRMNWGGNSFDGSMGMNSIDRTITSQNRFDSAATNNMGSVNTDVRTTSDGASTFPVSTGGRSETVNTQTTLMQNQNTINRFGGDGFDRTQSEIPSASNNNNNRVTVGTDEIVTSRNVIFDDSLFSNNNNFANTGTTAGGSSQFVDSRTSQNTNSFTSGGSRDSFNTIITTTTTNRTVSSTTGESSSMVPRGNTVSSGQSTAQVLPAVIPKSGFTETIVRSSVDNNNNIPLTSNRFMNKFGAVTAFTSTADTVNNQRSTGTGSSFFERGQGGSTTNRFDVSQVTPTTGTAASQDCNCPQEPKRQAIQAASKAAVIGDKSVVITRIPNANIFQSGDQNMVDLSGLFIKPIIQENIPIDGNRINIPLSQSDRNQPVALLVTMYPRQLSTSSDRNIVLTLDRSGSSIRFDSSQPSIRTNTGRVASTGTTTTTNTRIDTRRTDFTGAATNVRPETGSTIPIGTTTNTRTDTRGSGSIGATTNTRGTGSSGSTTNVQVNRQTTTTNVQVDRQSGSELPFITDASSQSDMRTLTDAFRNFNRVVDTSLSQESSSATDVRGSTNSGTMNIFGERRVVGSPPTPITDRSREFSVGSSTASSQTSSSSSVASALPPITSVTGRTSIRGVNNQNVNNDMSLVTSISSDQRTSRTFLLALCSRYLDATVESSVLAPFPGDCSRLVKCEDSSGKDITYTIKKCPLGLFFDSAAQACDMPQNVPCPDDQCLKGISSYPGNMGCRSYYSCEAGLSTVVCCPRGQRYIVTGPGQGQCVADPRCNDDCRSLAETNTGLCRNVQVESNPFMYWDLSPSGAYLQECPEGTRYSPSECGCLHDGSQAGTWQPEPVVTGCQPEFHLISDNDRVTDISDGGLAFEQRQITAKNGAVQFRGNSRINIWGFNNRHLGNTFAIHMRIRPQTLCNYGPQALLSNCGPMGQSSVEITCHNGQIVFKAESTLDPEIAVISKNFEAGKWLDIRYEFNGRQFSGAVEDRSFRVPLSGNLEPRNNPIMIGKCQGGPGFLGEMAKLAIYTECIPLGSQTIGAV